MINRSSTCIEVSSAADSDVFRGAGVWSQQAYLKASNTGTNNAFGISVSVSGDTVVVGAQGGRQLREGRHD